MNKKFLSVALFGALLALAPGTFTSCKDYDDDIDSVNERVDETQATLTEKANALQSALDAANREIEAAKTAAANAKTAADKAAADATAAIATAKAAAITEAVNQIKALNYASATDVQNVLTKVTALETALGNIKIEDLASKEQVEALQKALDLQAEALKEFVKNTDYAADKAKLQAWIEEINTFKGTVATKEDLADLAEEISGYNANLAALNALFSRLTSIVYAPSCYIDGVEAIPFLTLKYTPWNITAEDPADWTVNTQAAEVFVDDGKNSAYYYINPSYIAAENINLKVLDNMAVNFTRAAETDMFTATVEEVKDGKMKVNFKKNVTGSLNIDKVKQDYNQFNADSSIVIAVQAQIDSNTFITSDWARVFEASAVPHIHYAGAKKGVKEHFWSYDEAEDVDSAILHQVPYTKSIDLDTLVKVVAHEMDIEDYKSFGLHFEFESPKYLQQSATEQPTDQSQFIKIDSNHIATSRPMRNENETNNRSAIGRKPLIRVKLMHGDNVVDVRYFKIQWTDVAPEEQEPVDLGNLDMKFGADSIFGCDSTYYGYIGTVEMNHIFAELNITNEEMGLVDTITVHAELNDAKAGEDAITTLGKLLIVEGTGEAVTYNIAWEIPAQTLTKAEYEAGKLSRTAYGSFVLDGVRYVFNVTINLTVNKPALIAGYVQTYWSGVLKATNADKMFQVNPALTSDTLYGKVNYNTCRIITNMLNGYNVKDTNSLKLAHMVSNASAVKLIFDEARMKEGWSVSADSTTLLVNGIDAAQIFVDGDVAYIQLCENNDTATVAAKTLVGQKVPVKLVAKHCSGFESVLDSYLVHFIEPLKAEMTSNVGVMTDLLTGGDTLRIATVLEVTEKFGEERLVVYEDEDGKLAVNNELYGWYGVKPATWDLAKAMTNLNIDGNNVVIGDEFKTLFSAHAAKYKLDVLYNTNGYPTDLLFHNNSGTHIQQAFKVRIPVSVETKWNSVLQDVDNTYFEVTIQPGNTGTGSNN